MPVATVRYATGGLGYLLSTLAFWELLLSLTHDTGKDFTGIHLWVLSKCTYILVSRPVLVIRAAVEITSQTWARRDLAAEWFGEFAPTAPRSSLQLDKTTGDIYVKVSALCPASI